MGLRKISTVKRQREVKKQITPALSLHTQGVFLKITHSEDLQITEISYSLVAEAGGKSERTWGLGASTLNAGSKPEECDWRSGINL